LTVNIVLMHFRKRKQSEISLDETLQLDDESPERSVEFGGPDLNLNSAIDRINLDKAIEPIASWLQEDANSSRHRRRSTQRDLADFGLLGWEFKIQLHKAVSGCANFCLGVSPARC